MLLTRTIAALVGASLLALAPLAAGQSRDSGEIVADIEALQAPQYDSSRRSDRDYVNSYLEARRAHMRKRAALALELFEADPNHPQTQKLMMERWSTLLQAREFDTVVDETEAIARGNPPLALDAAYMHAQAVGQRCGWKLQEAMPAIDAFIMRAGDDERGARLLSSAAQQAPERDDQLTLYRRMIADYPDARSTKYAPGKIRQLEGVGRPFELAFQDAVTGETVDLVSQHGTIFVIDFWATWCGPCVAEMPNMKELYAAYKDRGVQFIGVSLDQPEDKGGLEKLRAYVKDNEIGWPQYYQGNYWDSEFSSSWGVNSIPCLFVVDHKGNLHSTSARGKLEEMLPALIKDRDRRN